MVTQRRPERLQKLLAQAGITSRRKAEEMITNGRVLVNGKVPDLGSKATLGEDKILVDGKPIHAAEQLVYFRLHKPRGYITALSDDKDRPVVTDLLPDVTERIFPVGRLDYDTEGLLILTNDGALAHALMHPSYQIQRTYYAKLQGNPSADTLRKLIEGVQLDDGLAQALHVERLQPTSGGNTWVEITITEGRNREIRRMCEAIGHPVMRLRRVRFANLGIEDLPPGQYRPLSDKDLRELRALIGSHAPQHQDTPAKKPKRPLSAQAALSLDDDDDLDETDDTYTRPKNQAYANAKPKITPRDTPIEAFTTKKKLAPKTSEKTTSPTTRTRSERPASSRSERPSSSRSERTSSTRSEKPSSTRSEKPASSRSERPSSTRSEKSASSRSERPSSTRSEKPASSRSERPYSTRSEKPASSRSERPASTRSEKPASSRSEKPSRSTPSERPQRSNDRPQTSKPFTQKEKPTRPRKK